MNSSNLLHKLMYSLNAYLTESGWLSLLFFVILLIFAWKLIRYLIQVNAQPCGVQHVDHQRPPPLVVESFDCPFKLNIKVDSASFSGIQCTLKSEVPCLVKAFWGVPFYQIISLMNSEIYFLHRVVSAYNSSSDIPCIDHHFPQLVPAHEEAYLEYKPRDHTKPFFSLPESKLHVPFLLLIVSESNSCVNCNTVVAMASIVHLENPCNPVPTSLKYRIIKLSSGLIGNIEQIYQDSVQEGDSSCLVCCTRPAKIVFIPCRHCCLCYDCYDSLKNNHDGFQERCPICRQYPERLFELPDVT